MYVCTYVLSDSRIARKESNIHALLSVTGRLSHTSHGKVAKGILILRSYCPKAIVYTLQYCTRVHTVLIKCPLNRNNDSNQQSSQSIIKAGSVENLFLSLKRLRGRQTYTNYKKLIIVKLKWDAAQDCNKRRAATTAVKVRPHIVTVYWGRHK